MQLRDQQDFHQTLAGQPLQLDILYVYPDWDFFVKYSSPIIRLFHLQIDGMTDFNMS